MHTGLGSFCHSFFPSFRCSHNLDAANGLLSSLLGHSGSIENSDNFIFGCFDRNIHRSYFSIAVSPLRFGGIVVQDLWETTTTHAAGLGVLSLSYFYPLFPIISII